MPRQKRWSSVLHGVRDLRFGEVADSDEGCAASQDGTKNVVGVAGEEMLERFAGAAVGLEGVEKAGDGVGNFIGPAPEANGTRDGSDVTDTAADAEIVGVDQLAIDLDFLALDADVGDPVLAATIGAAGDVKFELMLEIGIAVFESFGEPASEALGFGESEFAKFGAGAGYGAADESGTCDGESAGGELGDDSGDASLGDIDEEKILHRSGADVAVGVAFGEIGGKSKLRGSDASTNDGGANGEEAGLLLGNDAEMIAMNVRRESFDFSGIERETEALMDSGEERFGSPVVLEEKIFHAGTLAALAKNLTGTEDFANGADDGDDLMWLDENVEANA
jgi:hypothetical protein